MKNKISILALALASIPAFAGTMGAAAPERLFFVEGGFAYSHVFYNSHAIFPESFTTTTPDGFAINPQQFYPADFYGGYFGASFYFPGWLLNTRYSIFGNQSKVNTIAGTSISLQPSKLAFTADAVGGNIQELSYGLGAGAVIESLNNGEARIAVHTTNPASESLQGRTQVNPLVEGFVMYRFANNVGAKLNLEYQIPINNTMGNGDLNLSLGLNYAWPV